MTNCALLGISTGRSANSDRHGPRGGRQLEQEQPDTTAATQHQQPVPGRQAQPDKSTCAVPAASGVFRCNWQIRQAGLAVRLVHSV